MKVLVVDDNPRRYPKLLARLTTNGLTRDDVQLVQSAMDARKSLGETKFDLLVVDILLPLRPEDPPEDRHSLELLQELIETDDLHRPRHIVGLTADADAASRAEPFFRDHVWTVIEYSETNDDWIGQIENCVKYIDAERKQVTSRQFETDVAIVCALADPELKAILKLPWGWRAPRPIDDSVFVYEGDIPGRNGRSFSVVAAAASRMGMVSAALLSAKLIENFRPKLIAMTGICAGVRGKANLGDVLFVDPSWDWQSGRRSVADDSSVFSVSPHQLPAPVFIRSRFEQLATERAALSAIADAWEERLGQLRLIVGPVASGSSVLADGRVVQEIKDQHRELCGVEMEAYGLYSAAAFASNPKPAAFAVKAVCDFGEEDKNDRHQRYAAYTSAEVFRLFVEKFFADLPP